MSVREALGFVRRNIWVQNVAITACVLVLLGILPLNAHGHSDTVVNADTLKVKLAAPEGGSVAEGATGHFTVSVAGSTAGGAVTVRYSVSGTATAGVDYSVLSGEVSVPQGEAAAQVAIEALDDGVLDRGETVVLALTGAAGTGTVSVDATPATATIVDDGSVEVSLAAFPDTVPEGSPATTALQSTGRRWRRSSTNACRSHPMSRLCSRTTDRCRPGRWSARSRRRMRLASRTTGWTEGTRAALRSTTPAKSRRPAS